MTEEIKEILDDLKKYANEGGEHKLMEYEIKHIQCYITNLQQDLEKANKIIEKDRQFYKCRMDEYVELKKENEILKECYCNRTDCSGRLKDSKKYNSVYQEKEDYKSRFEKTIEYINFVINHYKEQLETPIEDTYFDTDVNRKGYILSIIAYLQATLDTLIGSDENETK